MIIQQIKEPGEKRDWVIGQKLKKKGCNQYEGIFIKKQGLRTLNQL